MSRRLNVALANFGVPKYGATLVGEIVYPNPSSQYSSHAYQCHPAACNYGCSFFNESQPPFRIEKKPGMHYIMLLDRGPRDHTGLPRPCYFIDKAYHAQMAGADALLVVNDNLGDLSTAVAPKDEDSTRELSQTAISAGLISQTDGDTIKGLLQKGPVSVALNWTDLMPKASKVEWEFWTNSNDECGAMCDKQKRFVKVCEARIACCLCCVGCRLLHPSLCYLRPRSCHVLQDFKPIAEARNQQGG
eukprot:GHRR01027431.1.p1 GENE.GHRR01027431.1~~GHRR01027431.1.p1  ORF type:complete len:246 (+),score=33.82 GHRR01027431.1:159-896(+)